MEKEEYISLIKDLVEKNGGDLDVGEINWRGHFRSYIKILFKKGKVMEMPILYLNHRRTSRDGKVLMHDGWNEMEHYRKAFLEVVYNKIKK